MNPMDWMTPHEWIFTIMLICIIYGIGLAPRIMQKLLG